MRISPESPTVKSRALPQIFQLVKHIFIGIVYINFDLRRIQILHRKLFGKRSNKQSFNRIQRGDFVWQQRSLRFVSILQKDEPC